MIVFTLHTDFAMPERQVLRHYQIERELANRLRHSHPDERTHLYTEVYDELYRRVPDHPMLVSKETRARQRAHNVRRMMQLIARYLRPETVFMEIGGGDCQLSRAIAPRIARVIAVEVSAALSGSEPLPENVALEIINQPTDIPTAPGSVHLAFSDQVAEHLLPDDFARQTCNVLAALAPGGHYIIVTPSRLNGPHDVSRGFDSVATGLHLKEYTVAELKALLLSAGFSQVHALVGVKGVYFKTAAGLVVAVESLLQRLPARIATWLANTVVLQQIINVRVVATK